jgi:predicted ATPase/transcriptional regulator with GAF, ATPase, and Fis domain/serine/threonine protein kinase
MFAPGFTVRELLPRSSGVTLLRAVGDRDGARVIIKHAEPRTPRAVVSLAREAVILRDLAIEGVPRVIEFLAASSALVLEDTGASPLCALLGRGGALGVGAFLVVARGLARTLARLHAVGIAHRNVAPSAVLVDLARHRTELIDFELASRIREESLPLDPARLLGARLVYASPEQTGRMNRLVDHRTDFYSLGAVLYHVLTGHPPFPSGDPLELVHAHIARVPPAPCQLAPAIPEPASDIVMKLLAKNAEERYQSAAGLIADLDECSGLLGVPRDRPARDREGAPERAAEHPGGEPGPSRPSIRRPFTVGRHDGPERLLVSQRLYGREAEIDTLLATFEEAAAGASSLILVGGYSGVGKTSLVQEVHKPIAHRRGIFLSGKLDQVARNAPYGAVAGALRGLVHQLLGEPDDRLAVVRSSLREALGPNAGVVTAVIPELSALLGPHERPPPFGPTEAENRLHYALQSLFAVFARPDQPLVLFLDDLQWADAATLKLVAALVTSPQVHHFLVIGAYRDNEAPSDHPLVRMVAELREQGAVVRVLALRPLARPDLTRLIADTLQLGEEPERAEALAQIVEAKTEGNPFFVNQFLRSLETDGLLRFEPSGDPPWDGPVGHPLADAPKPGRATRRWSFDLEAINAQATMTDNVVELMHRKLQRLPAETRGTLALAACIGNAFSLGTLSVIRESPREALAAALWPAVAEGLVRPTAERFEVLADVASLDLAAEELESVGLRFLHDRVQQAAYELIPGGDRPVVHLRVGRLLLGQADGPEVPAERLFEIVDHLNVGRALIDDEAERQRLCGLNLAAGRRAKAQAAFQAALGYFEAAASLLNTRAWEADHDRAHALYLELAECRSLGGLFEEAERAFSILLLRSRTRVERARVYNLKILQSEARARYGDGISAAREVLALFNLDYPEEPVAQKAALDAELGRIDALLANRPVAELLEDPPLADPEIRVLMRLLLNLHTSCYLAGAQPLTLLNTSVMVRLSLTHGHAEESAHAYMLHAMHVGQVRGELAAAFELGRLALGLSERFPDPSVRAKVLMNFSWAVSLWRRPMSESFRWAREAFRLGNETGMFVDAGYAAFNESYFQLLAADDLAEVAPAVDTAVTHMRRVRMEEFVDAPLVIGQWAAALRGRTAGPTSLDGDGFNEERYLRRHGGHSLFEMFFLCAKLALLVTFGEPAAAAETAERAAAAIRDYTGTIWDQLCVFHRALALAALHPSLAAGEQTALVPVLRGLEARLDHWAVNCPENFGAARLMVAAEIARVTGDGPEASRLYEQAIAASSTRGCLRDRGLANELCARFWLSRQQPRVAAVYLVEARAAFAAWGAAAKVTELERRHAELLEAVAGRAGQGADESRELDFDTAMKSAQAITREIERPRLLRGLVRIAIENAGAERGLLLREKDGALSIAAEGGRTGDEEVDVALTDRSAAGRSDVAWTVVKLAQNTGQTVLVNDARAEPRWLPDPYVRAARPRSILCIPLVQQGQRTGLLYLENNVTAHAFGRQRVDVLEVLAAQAGIALENARLYEELRAMTDRLHAENVYLQEEIRTEHNFEEIVGRSPALLETIASVERVAATDSTVLILGETGVGKELIARAIHSRGGRRDRPLVKVNCGAIAAGLVESELFGHVKGAFTGALQRRVGRFELADGGTILLDEVGELPLDAQVKLLRVLQERELEPVGSSRTVSVDVRVIAATNRDLWAAAREGRFRRDLLYRLNVFPLRVPSLAERRSDVPMLIGFFCKAMAKKLGKTIDGFGRKDMERMVAYPWPGNIRELQNVIERAAILAKGPLLTLDPHGLGQEVGASGNGHASGDGGGDTLADIGRLHIRRILDGTGGVIEGPRGAARILGLNPNTLRSRLKKLGITARPA